jgi:2-polyprenyl-3-methyl-5-hydroxy-6-metoxy-1,4-benzoquinol methylase
MEANFWNKRYAERAFAYGTEPNDFLKSIEMPANRKVLCLAEGEGRNGIFLATQGHQVTCVDYAEEGIKKAQKLANLHHVEINGICCDLNDFKLGVEEWDAVILIFGHFPNALRQKVHTRIYKSLKPGGFLVLEAYSKKQLSYNSGGPKLEEMLYDEEMLKMDFSEFKTLDIITKERSVNEGLFHNGLASVIQIVGRK